MDHIFPMNAKAAKDKFEELMYDDNYSAQEKIDGVRALIHISQEGVKITTRGASVDSPDVPLDITHRIPCLEGWEPAEELQNCIFDSEITIKGLDSSQIAGIVSYKSQVPIPEGLKFNVFDIINVNNTAIFILNQNARDKTLRNKESFFPSFMKTLPIAYGTVEKQRMFSDVISRGGEGIMLKNLKATYAPGKRPSNTWYKVKKIDSTDAKIVGSEPPERFYKDPKTAKIDFSRETKPWELGWFGAIVYELEDGTRGTVSGFTDTEKEEMSDGYHRVKRELIGKYIELKFMEKTKKGRLRHPRFIRIREEIEK